MFVGSKRQNLVNMQSGSMMTKTKGESAVDMKWRRSKMEETAPEDNERKVEDTTEKRRLEGQTQVPDKGESSAMVKHRGEEVLSRGEPWR